MKVGEIGKIGKLEQKGKTSWGWAGPSSAQAGLDFTLIFCRFGFSWLGLGELVGWI